jgi:hypothetical protein
VGAALDLLGYIVVATGAATIILLCAAYGRKHARQT